MTDLQERDRKVIWHPYTQVKTAAPVLPIVRGEGVYLFDDRGRSYIDAVSSWWVTLHGHAHPYIAQRVSAQLHTLEQVIFAGFTHQPAIELAERLLELLPANQQKVFYTDNGSTAIEVALKMCLQFWSNQGMPKRKIFAFKDAYHGDTFGAMSVSGRSVWTQPFDAMLFQVEFIDTPNPTNVEQLKNLLTRDAADTACFIYEPLVQGSAGMLMHDAASLSALMKHCRSQGILMIQDEVFTGFGRTGKLFAANHLTEQPDIMCFSKGLTGGTLPMGITTCNNALFEAFYSDDKHKALFHGHSFTANPLACTAALASLELLLEGDTQESIARISGEHAVFLKELQQHPKVKEVRQTGTILAVEWKTTHDTSYFNPLRDQLYEFFLDQGVLMRPLGNIIYILPPYCITNEELAKVYQAIRLALEDL